MSAARGHGSQRVVTVRVETLEVQKQLRQHLLQLLHVHMGQALCLGLPDTANGCFYNEDLEQLGHKLQRIPTDFGLLVFKVQVQQFAHQLLVLQKQVLFTGSRQVSEEPRLAQGALAGAVAWQE